jgi:uncharacterized repeat protein (TIGR01451 family)
VGQTVSYTLTVHNNGPDPATNVVVRDVLPEGLTYVDDSASQGLYSVATGLWSTGALDAGATAVLEIQASVDGGTGNTTITNWAEIESLDQADPVPDNDQDTAWVNVSDLVPHTDLEISKAVDDATPDEGQAITYTITVRNNGLDPATGVVVSDVLPAGVTYEDDTASQGSYSSTTGQWNAGVVDGGATASLEILVTVDAATGGASTTNWAEVIALDQVDPVSDNDQASAVISVTVPPDYADLQLTKVVDDGTPDVGQTVTYTVTVRNNGPDPAGDVVVTDLLPGGVSYVHDLPSQGAYTHADGRWSVGNLGVAEGATLEIQATVDPGTEGATLTNWAEIESLAQVDPSAANDRDSAGATVNIPPDLADLSLAKAAALEGTLDEPTAVFTVTVRNDGPLPASGVVIADPVPAGMYLLSATPSWGAYSEAQGRWVVGNLAVGVERMLILRMGLNQPGLDLEYWSRSEVAALDQVDPVPANNMADAIIDQGFLEITVIDGDIMPLGKPLDITVIVANVGNYDVTRLPFTFEYDPAFLQFVGASISPNNAVNDGRLDWSDLLQSPVRRPPAQNTLAPGDSVTLVISFTGLDDTTTLPGAQTPYTAMAHGAQTSSGDPRLTVLPGPETTSDGVGILIPTGVSVLSSGFRAEIQPDGRVQLSWRTLSEYEFLGFRIVRRTLLSADAVPVTPGLVLATASGTDYGAEYTYLDDLLPPGVYIYELQILSLDGQVRPGGQAEVQTGRGWKTKPLPGLF